MDRLTFRFLGVVALQFLILSSIIGYKQYTVVTGETVRLKVQPIDPRSLFRGDYVRLSFDISQLDLNRLAPDEYFGSRDTVYVELAPGDDGYWHAVAAYRTRRAVEDGHILLKGKTESARFFGPDQPSSTVAVDYGIEEVFVPEGSGRAVETSRAELGLEVRVDRFGNAVPRRILVDGEPFKLKRK